MSETTDFLALPDARPPTLDEQQQAIRDKVAAAVDAGFSEAVIADLKKKIDSAYCSLQDNIEWSLKQDIQDNLAHYVQNCARSSIEAMLEGNIAEVSRYLHCEPGYTRREYVQTWPSPFEPSPMALRRKLVEAYPELIEQQRILDLQATIKHLEAALAKAHKKISELQEEVSEYIRGLR